MSKIETFDNVVKILESDRKTLKELAAISRRDVFTFFRGSTLAGLDLSGQDLTGLNFDYADLRSSNINGIKYDVGAFNKSVLDDNQKWAQDEYEFYLNEVVDFNADQLLILVKIRPEFVDIALQVLRKSYAQFCDLSNVSANSLRKSRNGNVISMQTAKSILSTIADMLPSCDIKSEYLHAKAQVLAKQPLVEFLFNDKQGVFHHISKEDLERLRILRQIKFEDFMSSGNVALANYRDTPNYLYSYYDI